MALGCQSLFEPGDSSLIVDLRRASDLERVMCASELFDVVATPLSKQNPMVEARENFGRPACYWKPSARPPLNATLKSSHTMTKEAVRSFRGDTRFLQQHQRWHECYSRQPQPNSPRCTGREPERCCVASAILFASPVRAGELQTVGRRRRDPVTCAGASRLRVNRRNPSG